MQLKSVESLPDVRGKRVLVRVDHNVEFGPDGALKDDRKLKLSLRTLEYLADRGATLALMTHVGRPKGKAVEELRTAPIAGRLREISPKLREHGFEYLENVRFDPREEGSDEAYARELIGDCAFFVNEAFPSLHTYEETSTCAVARLLPAYAGYHLLGEVRNLSRVLDDPRRPLVLIVGGAKMKTKIPVIRRFLDLADHILLGGCVANTFIAARGFDVGASAYEADAIDLAQEIMLEGEKEGKATVHVPRDAVVATEVSEGAQKLNLPLEDIEGDMKIFDIGKVTIERYKREIEKAGTVIWNGPMGLYEYNRFSHASKRIAGAVAQATASGAFTLVGGGDTIDFHARYAYPLEDAYGFVSSGGGAMLEFLSSEKPLPALVPLMEEVRAVG